MAFMQDQNTTTHFYAHGKLLLTAEYFVLDGTPALAIPCKYGQHLQVENSADYKNINWTAQKQDGSVWLEFTIDRQSLEAADNTSPEAQMISKLLQACKANNEAFLNDNHGFNVTTRLEFPQNWGLGSSSTLVYLLANWASVNPYQLLEASFGGSGYDIAAAGITSPFLYVRNAFQPEVTAVNFSPAFSSHLYFVHLNQKMNSREAIQYYRALGPDKASISKELEHIGQNMIHCESLDIFMSLMEEHEAIIATALKMQTVKSRCFDDLQGSVKSLGAWGGDFVMIATKEPKELFTEYLLHKGYSTIIPYEEMIYKEK